MENTDIYIGPEPHIEVHKYYGGVVPAAVMLALVLQAFFPIHFRWANYLELPLLVTLYFALSKRNRPDESLRSVAPPFFSLVPAVKTTTAAFRKSS